ncbi:hypothetical protein K493DRAFT_378328 [Basidiobolus meristosporus CBS 931.73]|uniref:Uncharacterized protein n=1 Tax=Basidiobolus meristosporus CBS 931.73 TaxID=1314790 RepID=A0A1Y1Y212_9FUNG|nr:hypothetical protein K493DRAFT_378328 [Basidiobolus meristosporus CBS 931.73]|eukprot:ORX91664.1 hypothetical protein K493DRAFT_378328 [Basidiobolus meristosporus CBS 931.73]
MAPISPTFQPVASPTPTYTFYSSLNPTLPFTNPLVTPTGGVISNGGNGGISNGMSFTSANPGEVGPVYSTAIGGGSGSGSGGGGAVGPIYSSVGPVYSPVNSGAVGPVYSSFDPFATQGMQPTVTAALFDPLNQGNVQDQVAPVQVVMDAASPAGSSSPPEGTYVMVKSEQGDPWLLPYNQDSIGRGPVVVFGNNDQRKVRSGQLGIIAYLGQANILWWLIALLLSY